MKHCCQNPDNFSLGNIDLPEETLSVKGATHVANGIIIQNRRKSGPVHLREKVVLSKKESSPAPPSTNVIGSRRPLISQKLIS